MPSTCCVPGCFNIGGFRFPKDRKLRDRWIINVCRENMGKKKWVPNQDDRVCEAHFDSNDVVFKGALNTDKIWRTLRPGAIPRKPTHTLDPEPEKVTQRRQRAKNREEVKRTHSQAFPTTSTAEHPSSSSSTSPSGEYGAADSDSADGDCADGDCADGDGADRRREGNNEGGSRSADSDFPVVAEEDLPDVVFEVTIADREEENHTADEKLKEEQKTGKVDKSVQVANTTSLTFGCVSIENLSDLPGGFSYYTSFQDLDHFMYVFSCLGPASMHLAYQSQKLKPQDEFLLLMMKLRLNKDDQELAWFFGISTNTVSRIFKTWLNFLYYQLKELKIWNSRAIVDIHMPSDFQKKFPNTRVILDGSEVPIEKPSDLRNQSATWSNYKNRNTLKVMVGISPRGDISYISEVYGGATSDRQIVESSDLLRPGTFERGDSIMADRGFIVQDLFCLHNVHVNIPTVMRNMVQLPQEKVIQDRRIASKRVHVERMIGLAKTFRILKEELHHSYVPLGGRILFVCLALQNFRPSIMNNSA